MKGINITKKEIELIHYYLFKGYELNEVAKITNCSLSTVYKYSGYVKNIIPVHLGFKNEPYYINEDDYCREYNEVKYKDLSKEEQNIYNNGKIQHKSKKSLQDSDNIINMECNTNDFNTGNEIDNNIYDIIFKVSKYYEADMFSVLSQGDRLRNNIDAKRMSLFLIKEKYPTISNTELGGIFKIDRTTVTYYLKQVKTFLKTDRLTKTSYKYFKDN